MFKKLFNRMLIKSLKKRFNKLTPEEKLTVRDMVIETKSDTVEKKQKVKERRKKKMADEKEVKKDEVVQPQVEEQKKDEVTKEEVKTETKEPQVAKEETKKEEVVDKEKEGEAASVDVEQEPSFPALRVEDIVTKDEMAERIAALEAKIDAVLKENKDLTDKLSESTNELNGMKDKYENKDFGNMQKQGMVQQNKSANSTFDEYSKQFM